MSNAMKEIEGNMITTAVITIATTAASTNATTNATTAVTVVASNKNKGAPTVPKRKLRPYEASRLEKIGSSIDARSSREDEQHKKQIELWELQITNENLRHKREMLYLARRERLEVEIH